ncbi:GntR family transcriptional regulator [Streptomyces luteireticuli]|uniref:GntR family transcriptional regulator n=1 Tax=Streptomyces luteireticuli TaxID=173858 RepID=UPI003555FA39
MSHQDPHPAQADQLGADLERLRQAVSTPTASSPAAVVRAHSTLDEIAGRWKQTAHEYRAAAAGSAADQARWEALIASAFASTLRRHGPQYEDVVLRSFHVRALLRAVRDSAPPTSSVASIAARITQAVADGTYPPGSVLSPGNVARDLGERPERVQLALSDLVAAGRAETSGRRILVARLGGHRDHFVRHLADQLVQQIAAGLYPPGTPLPPRRNLMRSFAISQPTMTAVQDLLLAEGRIQVHRGGRSPMVVDALPTAAAQLTLRRREPPSRQGAAVVPDLARVPEMARRIRAWRRGRSSPTRDILDQHLDELTDALRYLIPCVKAATTANPAPNIVEQRRYAWRIAHACWLETATPSEDLELRVWHGACLSNAVEDLLRIEGVEVIKNAAA